MINPVEYNTAYSSDSDSLYHSLLAICSVSWGAVLMGSATTVALMFTVMLLGNSAAYLSESLWLSRDDAVATINQTNILFLAMASLFFAAIGGFVTGWLCTTSQKIDSEAAYFRYTLHGFLMWVIAALAIALLMATVNSSRAERNAIHSMAMSLGSERAAVAGTETGGMDDEERDSASADYFVAALSRMDHAIAATMPKTASQSIANTMTRAITSTSGTKKFIGTSLDFFALWVFLALLCGAVIASVAATYGGQQHDA